VFDALDILDEVDDMVKASDKRIEAVRAMVNRGSKHRSKLPAFMVVFSGVNA